MGPERFVKTLKREEVYLHDYRTFEEAEANLSRFIEDVYKRRVSRSWTLRAEIRLMAVFIVRSGRNILPATSHPSTNEMSVFRLARGRPGDGVQASSKPPKPGGVR